MTEELHFGRGFFALRGLNPDRYSREDNILLFLGVSAYVGENRGKQDDKGHIFGQCLPSKRLLVASLQINITTTAHIREAKYMQEGQAERPIRDSNVASVSFFLVTKYLVSVH